MAIHDEQGVVHAHTECDQLGQLRGELGDAEGVGEDADERRPDPDGHHRGQQGEQGAEQRATEGEEQHHQCE